MSYNGEHYVDISALGSALGVEPKHLVYFADHVSEYVKKRSVTKRDGKKRGVMAPNKELKHIQRQIKDVILSSYSYPEYVYGLGGNTLKDHANVHAGAKSLVKTDITDFFPSITHTSVYKMWTDEFGFSTDVARLLTKLTTHGFHLQQGFPTSSHIAAIVAMPLTNSLAAYSKAHDYAFSQYVDDLNVSGHHINEKEFFQLIIELARANNFSIKRKKTKMINGSTGKTITGASVHKERIRAPKIIRKRAIDALKSLDASPDDEHNQRRVSGYKGFLSHLSAEDGRRYAALLRHIHTKKRR